MGRKIKINTISRNIISHNLISSDIIGGEAPSGDSGLISEFTIVVASASAGGKNNFRGYSKGQFVNFGSTSGSTFDLADGTTVQLASTSYVTSLAFAFFEFDTDSSTDRVDMRVHILGATAPPTFNDSNWFKSLKVINNTDSTDFTIQRSGFTSPNTVTDNTNCISTIQYSKTGSEWSETFFDTGDSITVQLRSD